MARPKRFELLTPRFVVSKSNGGHCVLHSRLLSTAPVSHQKRAQRTRLKSIENTAQSTKPIGILPLITVWLQVRILPGSPINQSLIGFSFPPALGSLHQKRLTSLLVTILQPSANYCSTAGFSIIVGDLIGR